MPYPFSVPRPTVSYDLDETEVEQRDGGCDVLRFHVSNPSADTVGYFKAWDCLAADLNEAADTDDCKLLFDHPVPAGQTFIVENLPIERGFTTKFTGASGRTDATAPAAGATVHDWKME